VDAVVAAGGVVGEGDLHAVALVGADDQRLDRVRAQADRHLVAALLGAHRRDLVGGHEHLALRVVVAEAVQRDVDVDGLDGIAAHGGAVRAWLTRAGAGDGELRRGDGEHAAGADDDQRDRTPQHRACAHARRNRPTLTGRRRPGLPPRHRGRRRECEQQGDGECRERVAAHVQRPRQLRGQVVVAEGQAVERVAEAEHRARRRRHQRGGEHRADHRARLARAVEDPAAEQEPRPHGDEDQRERERAVAQPVDEQGRLVVLVRALREVQDVHPQDAAVGERDREHPSNARSHPHRGTAAGEIDELLGHDVLGQWCAW
jgi:hypothetical protein